MSNIDKETLQKKKQELEAELKSIEDELDDSLDQVKSDISSSLDPVEYIKRHPIPVVGFSVIVGFLIGHDGDERHHHREESTGSEEKSKRKKLTSTLGYEAKRLLTRKAFSVLSNYLDDILHP